jgi:hypothetical protein
MSALSSPTEWAADTGRFFRGLVIALTVSVPIWGVILVAFWRLL